MTPLGHILFKCALVFQNYTLPPEWEFSVKTS